MKKLLLVLLVVVFLLSACNKQVYRMDYDKESLMEQAKTDCASILDIDIGLINGISVVENITNTNNEVIAYVSYDKKNSYALKYEIMEYKLFELIEHGEKINFNEI